MTVVIWGVDALDYRYVEERGLLAELDPQPLEQDLGGLNALYTLRVWPAIFAGVNGGRNDDVTHAKFHPDEPFVWEKWPAAAFLPPVSNEPPQVGPSAFPNEYREGTGFSERYEDARKMYDESFRRALDENVEIVVLGTRLPDILGHHDQNRKRVERQIQKTTDLVEKHCRHEQVDDWLVVSDHGFDYEKYGEEPSGIEAHTRSATLASSFADYNCMSEFIEGWHDDLEDAINKHQLAALGYIE